MCGVIILWEGFVFWIVLLGNIEWERERSLIVKNVMRVVWNVRD